MRKFTTPTLAITLKKKTGEIASDLVFEYLIFSLKSGTKRLDKRVESAEVTEGTFKVIYTQEETGAFMGATVRAEINIFSGSTRLGTLIKDVNLEENLINEVV